MPAKKRKKPKSLLLQQYQSLTSNRRTFALVLLLVIGLGYLVFKSLASSGYPDDASHKAAWNQMAPGIRQCESTGNWRDNTGNGFFGAYQFDHQTWTNTFGYSQYHYNNASDAPAAIQDLSAYETYLARGDGYKSTWPNTWQCGASHPYYGSDDSTGSAADTHVASIPCGNPPNNCAGSGGAAPAPAPAGNSTIQGMKIDAHGGQMAGVRISIVDGVGNGNTSTTNPFSFGNLPAGLARVRATEIPVGWYLHGVTACENATNCHTEDNMRQINGTGSDAVVNVPAGGYNDLWFHFDQAPKGYLDTADCNHIAGWAFDPTDPTQSTSVHVYIDGQLVTPVSANIARNDVNTSQQIPGNHGFEWTLPDQYKDNNNHTVQVYAIDYPYAKFNPLLTNGQGTINCVPPSSGGGGGTFHPQSTGNPVIVPEPGTGVPTTPTGTVTGSNGSILARCSRLQGIINAFTLRRCGAPGSAYTPAQPPVAVVPANAPTPTPIITPEPSRGGGGGRRRSQRSGACPYVSGYVAQLLGC